MSAPADTRLTPASRLLWGWHAREGVAAARTGQTLSLVRDSPASVEDSSGGLGPIGPFLPALSVRSGIPALDLMPARTNHVLWSRDLTRAEWVKTNVTAVRNLPGLDGQPNTATRLQATVGNGTVIQDVTLPPGERTVSLWLRLISGSSGDGASLTVDGTTWIPLTLTTDWARYSIPWQTVTNPRVGIRLGFGSLVVAADWAQCETGRFATAPVMTTTAPVLREGDTFASTVGLPIPREGTLHARIQRAAWMDQAGDMNGDRIVLGLGTVNPRVEFSLLSGSRLLSTTLFDAAGGGGLIGNAFIPALPVFDFGVQWRTADTGIAVRILTNDTTSAWSASFGPVSTWGDGTLVLGDSAVTPGQQMAAGLVQVSLASGNLSLATLAEIL